MGGGGGGLIWSWAWAMWFLKWAARFIMPNQRQFQDREAPSLTPPPPPPPSPFGRLHCHSVLRVDRISAHVCVHWSMRWGASACTDVLVQTWMYINVCIRGHVNAPHCRSTAIILQLYIALFI